MSLRSCQKGHSALMVSGTLLLLLVCSCTPQTQPSATAPPKTAQTFPISQERSSQPPSADMQKTGFGKKAAEASPVPTASIRQGESSVESGAGHAEETGRAASPSLDSHSAQVIISYAYDGQFGVYGIADTAEARSSSQVLLAKAKLLRRIENTTGPVDFEVEEEHYSEDGSVVYRGKITFKYNMGDWVVGQTEQIQGTPKFRVFSSWPAGN